MYIWAAGQETHDKIVTLYTDLRKSGLHTYNLSSYTSFQDNAVL